jgi:hypothetical protein
VAAIAVFLRRDFHACLSTRAPAAAVAGRTCSPWYKGPRVKRVVDPHDSLYRALHMGARFASVELLAFAGR